MVGDFAKWICVDETDETNIIHVVFPARVQETVGVSSRKHGNTNTKLLDGMKIPGVSVHDGLVGDATQSHFLRIKQSTQGRDLP